MIRPTAALALIASLAAPAYADPTPLPLSYEMFEASVPHVDMALCPADLAQERTFCRMSVHAEQINVFAFSEEGDQPMVGFRSWSVDLMAGLLD
ncbi:hypothetical protein E7811_12570 [Aliigemmobacter aestuarii]|uniref:Uncharacterized protein n=1 Tax=Aliigemmobacter aestuarii TaxID=1445661 RepID=A0A4S3ML94_9RHOB|nr:hypothetical protein [Gemmobacter aestuarii]THD82974.1 hypothetical protein E7811_12570 [Gemmobacter aestuarii]